MDAHGRVRPQVPSGRCVHDRRDRDVTTHDAGRRLLIVDDEPEIREFVANVARRVDASLDIISAKDADDAERYLRDERIAGILTDLRMPGRSGIELLQLVAQERPDMNRALMTGFHDESVDGVRLDDLGLLGILRKPFSASDLRRLLLTLSVPRPDPASPRTVA